MLKTDDDPQVPSILLVFIRSSITCLNYTNMKNCANGKEFLS